MSALSENEVTDLERKIAELREQLRSALADRDAAIEEKTAATLEQFRLQTELRAALERQKASAEILRSIAATSGDAAHALRQIAETTAHFFNAPSVTIRIAEGDRWVQDIRVGSGSLASGAHPASPLIERGASLPATVYQENRQIHIPDLDHIDPSMAQWPAVATRAVGIRTLSGTPLRHDGGAIGALIIYRDRLAPFTDEELALQQSFADQAVIALENARLFNATREALERQTATAEVLQVIGKSMADPQPVFERIVDSIERLLPHKQVGVFLAPGDGYVHAAALRGLKMESLSAIYPWPVEQTGFRVISSTRQQVYYPDLLNGADVPPSLRRAAEIVGNISNVLTPMQWQGRIVGNISVTREPNVRFSDQELSLLRSFADQAMIAIENARLFNETQEALERQTATADILKVIASSPSDVAPVFDAIAVSANRLIGGFSTAVHRVVDDMVELAALTSVDPEADGTLRALFPRHRSEVPALASVENGETAQIADIETGDEMTRQIGRARGWRSVTFTPLMNQGACIGFIACTRRETGVLADHHVQLLRTFADQAVIAIENVRLFNETQEALERQTATADILRVINNSTGNLAPVFESILEKAHHLCGAPCGSLQLYDAGRVVPVAIRGMTEAFAKFLRAGYPITDGVRGVLFADRPIQLVDIAEFLRSRPDESSMRAAVELGGIGTMLTVPLAKDGIVFGRIVAGRREVRAFNDKQIALLQGFADQAVIAIENARLFNETNEALERQTATADILKVIASSPSDVQPVFEAILSRALRLCEAAFGFLTTHDGERFDLATHQGVPAALAEYLQGGMDQPRPGDAHWRLLEGEDLIHNLDQKDEDPYRAGNPLRRATVDLGGARSALVVALRKGGSLRGAVTIYRKEVRPFSEAQITLLRHFADQAVIAIENARLFNETREALERQTATADILKVIASNPADVQPVFDAIAESAKRLLGSYTAVVTRVVDGVVHLAAGTAANEAAAHAVQGLLPYPLSSERIHARVARTGELAVNTDVDTSSLPQSVKEFARTIGWRSMLVVPMLRNGIAIGTIGITRREAGSFDDKTIDLLNTFADQAVIAIENARLFNETREALERQTATADILKVIASSPSDVQPVFDTIAESAKRLLGCHMATVTRVIDGVVHLAAGTARSQAERGALGLPYPLSSDRIHARVARAGELAFRFDIETEPGVPESIREFARSQGYRSLLVVPMLRHGAAIGTIGITRREAGHFTDQEIDLLKTFADQAVIAIENTRLFNETQDALSRQTATAEILRVISGSPTDVQPVFDTIVRTAVRLLDCDRAFFMRVDGNTYTPVAGVSRDGPFPLGAPNRPIDPAANFPSRAIVSKAMLHLPDWAQVDLPEHEQRIREQIGVKSALYLPLLRGEDCIGLLILIGNRPNLFGDKEIALAESFRDQALIAIENTRLFNETKEALERQTATADILKVIASSPSDVAPVFEAIVASANRLLGGFSSTVYRFIDGQAHLQAFTPTTPEADEILKSNFPLLLDRFAPFEIAQAGEVAQIPDTETLTGEILTIARARGFRSMLFAPLMNKGRSIGIVAVTRAAPGTFADHHVQLLKTFADQAVIAIENARLFDEVQAKTRDLEESLQQQTATADVLKVISRSAFDLQPVFSTIVQTASRLCEAEFALIYELHGDRYEIVAANNAAEAFVKHAANNPLRPGRGSLVGRTALERKPVHIPDCLADPEYSALDYQAVGHYRAMLGVPLLRDGVPIGVVGMQRRDVRPFTDKQIELVQTFADQAVIAIENVRLFDEVQAKTRDLEESLQQQTATADVLRVIASSPTDVMPVLNAIVESACQLCEASDAYVALKDGDHLVFQAHHGAIPVAWKRRPINRQWPAGRAVVDRKPVHLHDVMAREGDEFPDGREIARRDGARSVLTVPLMREGESVGVIILRRTEVQPFTDKQIALLQTFADQAVIAIENARLFDEVQAKTRDIEESLQQQTATADVLKVIASTPTDIAPVLKAIVESAHELCDAADATVLLRDGNDLRYSMHHGPIPLPREKWPISRDWATGRAFVDKVTIHIHDWLSAEGDEFPEGRELAREQGHRTLLCVPLLREDEAIGVIALRRTEARPFTEKQIALLSTFADQAVIAIENTRLFNETKESLQQQTATADVLKVISSSAFDLQPVLDTLVETAAHLCDADMAFVMRRDGDVYRAGAAVGFAQSYIDFLKNHPLSVNRGSVTGRAVLERRTVHILDVATDPEYAIPESVSLARQHTALGVPLLRENDPIGVIVIARQRVEAFTQKQIDLVTTFADQAVIAIENVRLFDEVQARTRDLSEALEQQTATSEVLSVISSSAGDLIPVFDAMLAKAMQLCSANFGVLNTYDGKHFHTSATYGLPPAYDEYRRKQPLDYGPGTAPARLLQGEPFVEIDDLLVSDSYRRGDVNRRALVDLGGARSLLAVPLLQDDRVVGNVMIFRQERRRFSEKQITLLQQFAAQAVIAIENARLLGELRQRTADLSKSLDDLRTAQGRLIQTEKLASLGQLTAGIAHEIKNPLNFVNNFSALSIELADELKDLLIGAKFSEDIRNDVDELTGLLKDNLSKVVQHGKRADSIVKNMLLHSREGSGEHRPSDINALVEESLNLAYHGARAEKPQFNVSLQRDFDPEAGMIEVFPQEITRVLLNLISNGFYAVTKRKADNGSAGFEPLVTASTRGSSSHVEIRIRDNGTGIPPDVKEKMFNPFFTTKPAGEGTGLGLSMSHDIIVKQHGGTIDVDTEPGVFTEFTIVLPRTKK